MILRWVVLRLLNFWVLQLGEKDVCVGVPVLIGKNGVEKIVELKLNDAEKAKFAESTAAVREVNKAL